jgi:hypothetical protein
MLDRLAQGAMPSDDELRKSVERARQAFRTAQDGKSPLAWQEDAAVNEPAQNGPPPAPAPVPSASLHPFFRGLLDTLPEPGATWPQAERDQWLETARHIFALLYDDADQRQPIPFPQRSPDAFERRIA